MIKFIGPQARLAASLFAVMLLIAACGDDDDDPTGLTDQTPPSISDAEAVDVNHVEVTFSEDVVRASAEDVDNYAILDASADSLAVVAAALQADQSTVLLTTQSQGEVPYQLRIVGVADVHGNTITSAASRSFTGTTDPDVTAPALITSSPPANATDVAVGTSIDMTFTEPVTFASFSSGAVVTSSSGPVVYSADTDDGIHYTIVPINPLEVATVYTVTLTGLEDSMGNSMPVRTWLFTTTTVTSP